MLDPISAREFLIRDAGSEAIRTTGSEKPTGKSFADTLKGLVSETDEMQKAADQSLEDFSTGKITDVHEVMMSMNRADLSFRMMLEVRNKLVDAYTEVMRTQV